MNDFLKLTALTTAIAFGGLATTASAHEREDTPCRGEITAWADRDAVVAKATEEGITVKNIGMRGACFLVMGENADGERALLALKADTLEKVDMREGKRGRRGPGRRGGHSQHAPAPSTDG